jgi:predicted DNA repair protein MutK
VPSSLLALLDDITTVLDDVAVLTKVAAKKTAGVLGDDLALNAQQVTGMRPERELPVVWAVAKGSALNKVILVPAALAISALVPWMVVPLLMIGGAFLCYEGVEKLAHRFLHSKEEDEAHHRELAAAVADPATDMVAFEKERIRGAIRTDFILSAEIVTISLGTLTEATFATRVGALVAIAALMTIGVYGLVGGIVKLDDAGLYLLRRSGRLARATGSAIMAVAPRFMKLLSIGGTVAMFLVGGGIVVHGIPPLHHFVADLAARAGQVGGVGGVLAWLAEAMGSGILGVAVGAVVLGAVSLVKRLLAKRRSAAAD